MILRTSLTSESRRAHISGCRFLWACLMRARCPSGTPTTPTIYVFGGTRAWGAAAAVATATQRHDGDLFAVVLAPAPLAEMF